MNRPTGRQVDEQTVGWIERLVNKETNLWLNKQTGLIEQTVVRTDRQTNGQTNSWKDRQTDS
jgi:hypothetical protein